MANFIDTSQISDPSVQQPFIGPSLNFLQEATSEMIAALACAITGPILGGVPYVLTGCVGSGGTYSAGYIALNNQIYAVSAASGFTHAPVQYNLNLAYDGVADPLIFTDSSVHFVHQHITMVAVDTVTPGLFNSNQFVYVNSPAWITVGGSGAPTFLNSWSALIAVKFTKNTQGIVRLIGAAQKSGAITSSVPIFTLPAGYRPQADVVVPCFFIDSGTQKVGALTVTVAGDVYPIFSFISGSTATYIYLDSINFYIG